jgi:hypothetical protein
MGYYLDPAELIAPQPEASGPLADWIWRPLPEPGPDELPVKGQEWELTRYHEYQAQLAAQPVGGTFRLAAAFLRQASTGCLSPT